MAINVRYSSNNSGGGWWLNDEDWYALEKAGWNVEWEKDSTSKFFKADANGRWLGALATAASKEFDSMREAVEEFETITGQDVADEGCNCCGPPHEFSGEDENGNYVSGPEIIRSNTLRW